MISQTAEYALRAVVFLLQQNGAPNTRAEIAEGSLIPVEYLTRVMKFLSEQGIVTIHRGPGGGYTIDPDQREVTVLEVVSAVERIPRVDKCPLGLTDHEQLCPLHAKLDEAASLVEQSFRETKVIDLLPSSAKARRTADNRCSFPGQ